MFWNYTSNISVISVIEFYEKKFFKNIYFDNVIDTLCTKKKLYIRIIRARSDTAAPNTLITVTLFFSTILFIYLL